MLALAFHGARMERLRTIFQRLLYAVSIVLLCISDSSPQSLPSVPTLPPLPLPTSIRNIFSPGVSPLSEYTYRHTRVLNRTLGYFVSWDSTRNPGTITFNVTAPLSGSTRAVVFGLSRRGQVEGSDVAVIRLGSDGQSTILDMHGVNNGTLNIDNNQNWNLIGTPRRLQNGSISFTLRRQLDTCDDQDILINDDLVHLIYGTVSTGISGSTTMMPFTPIGSSREYLLDPLVPERPSQRNNEQTFRVSRRFQVPTRHTSYWCTFHKGPTLPRKHHITGFVPYFADETARRHIHHQIAYRCIAPPGIDPALIFQRYINHPGEECYLEQTHQLPTLFCTEIVHTYGLGGEGFTFPESIGLALGETSNEYFMLETHYNNEEHRADLNLEHGVDFQYTSQVRPSEGSILIIGAGTLGLHLTPPGATEFPQMGQCGSECTRNVIPLSGVQIVGAMLHGHVYTRKMRVTHIRGNREFPYISVDNNYDTTFQQIRHVRNSSVILPGDRIVVDSIQDTRSSNSTVLSGFSTRDEMSVVFGIFNKRLPYLYCTSEYPYQRTMDRFGIQNMTWDRELQERVINQANNPAHVGQTLANVIRNYEWTPERRAELVQEQVYGVHDASCPPVQRMAYIAYLAYFVETVTAGLISQRRTIDENRPSTRTVWTPKGPGTGNLTTTRMPREVLRYRPTEPCTEMVLQRNQEWRNQLF